MATGLKAVATACVLAGLSLLAAPAQAQDITMDKTAGDWLVRVRGIGVLPDESSSVTPIGGEVDLSNEFVPEVDLSYFVTDNIAFELIAATARHDVSDNGSTLGDVDLGEVSHLPPTLTLQYHFMPKQRFSPYVGAGLNYTIFYNADAPGGAVTSVHYDNGWGYALQAGFDVAVAENWSVNVDVKKLFIDTSVAINGGAVNASVDLDPWVVGLGVGYKF
jgi:outer membrane protein